MKKKKTNKTVRCDDDYDDVWTIYDEYDDFDVAPSIHIDLDFDDEQDVYKVDEEL